MHVTVMPVIESPEHIDTCGDTQPASDAASASLGQLEPVPVIVWHVA